MATTPVVEASEIGRTTSSRRGRRMSSLVALPDAEASSSLTKGMHMGPRFTETFKLHRQGTTSLQSNASQEKSALSRHKEEEFDAQKFDE